MKRQRHKWTPAQERLMRDRFPHERSADVAALLGLDIAQVNVKATGLGLKKSPAYLASPAACQLRRGDNVGAATRFKPGQAPHNKGKAYPARGRSVETQFRPGTRNGRAAQLWQPIGHERVTGDGYLQRKVTDTGYTPDDYVEVHRLLWEEHFGPIPAGHTVVFRNRDKTNTRIDNLELITRAELMRRNSYHNNYPKEIGRVIQLRGQIVRQINKRARHEKQD